MTAILLLAPALLAALLRLAGSVRLCAAALPVWAFCGLALSLAAHGERSTYFHADDLATLFLATLHAVFLAVSLHLAGTLRHVHVEPRRVARQASLLLLFVAAMSGVALSAHLALLWVFVEATTLASAPLVYGERTRASFEAAWKYIFIGSVGIALAFAGVIFLSIAAAGSHSLDFATLEAQARFLNPFWFKVAIPFLLVGFGTKAGLAPVHAWLPDAHSEAPACVSALLSGALLGTALIPAIRVGRIAEAAALFPACGRLLILMGFLSLLVAAVYLPRMHNFKRMLAYSSIEHIGVVAIGLGLGGAAVFPALLHFASHALAKTAFFLSAGTLYHEYGSKEIADVRGAILHRPATGWTFLGAWAALAGFPPFPLFLSEFLIARELVMRGDHALAALFFLLLLVAAVGTGRAVLAMVFGSAEAPRGPRAAALERLSPALALAALAVAGLSLAGGPLLLVARAAAR